MLNYFRDKYKLEKVTNVDQITKAVSPKLHNNINMCKTAINAEIPKSKRSENQIFPETSDILNHINSGRTKATGLLLTLIFSIVVTTSTTGAYHIGKHGWFTNNPYFSDENKADRYLNSISVPLDADYEALKQAYVTAETDKDKSTSGKGIVNYLITSGAYEKKANQEIENNKEPEQENENKVDKAPEQEKNEDNIGQGNTQKPENTQPSKADLIQESIKKFQNSIDAKLSNHSNVDATSVKVGRDEIVIKTNNNKELTIKTNKTAELENLNNKADYYSKLSEIVDSSTDYTYMTIQEKSYEVATGITQKMILNQVQETLKTNEYNDYGYLKVDDSNVYIHTNGDITTIKTKIADKEFELAFTIDSRGVLSQEDIEKALKFYLNGGHKMNTAAVSLTDIYIYDTDLETTIGQ